MPQRSAEETIAVHIAAGSLPADVDAERRRGPVVDQRTPATPLETQGCWDRGTTGTGSRAPDQGGVVVAVAFLVAYHVPSPLRRRRAIGVVA